MAQTPHDASVFRLPLSVAARLRLEASLTALDESDIVVAALQAHFARTVSARAPRPIPQEPANRQAAPDPGAHS